MDLMHKLLGTQRTRTHLFAYQLPPLFKFDGCTGCGGEEETVKEWLKQFQFVAGVCKWDDQTKLVNLVLSKPGLIGWITMA